MPNKQCLVLGPEGVGKTLLIKNLVGLNDTNQCRQSESVGPLIPTVPTQPTIGTNLIACKISNRKTVTLKECGGRMAPLWHKSLGDADMLIYIVDICNNTQISAATVLLMETLSHHEFDGKPVLLFYNKTDMAAGCPLSLEEFMEAMRVRDLVKKYGKDMFHVISGSCLSHEGLTDVCDWIGKHC